MGIYSIRFEGFDFRNKAHNLIKKAKRQQQQPKDNMSTVFFTPYTNENVFLPPFWRHNRRSYGRRFRHGRTILSDTDQEEVQLVLNVPGVKPSNLKVTVEQ